MNTPHGIITHPSLFTVKETIDRLEAFLKSNGVTIYARINQQAELQKAGLSIAPLEFMMFGSPKAGGPIMIENPLAALDLPLKIIAWQDADEKVFVSYNAAAFIEQRYSLTHHEKSPLNLENLVAIALKED